MRKLVEGYVAGPLGRGVRNLWNGAEWAGAHGRRRHRLGRDRVAFADGHRWFGWGREASVGRGRTTGRGSPGLPTQRNPAGRVIADVSGVIRIKPRSEPDLRTPLAQPRN